MAVKDISDLQVIKAYETYRALGRIKFPYEILALQTGQPQKVCYRAMERAARHGLIEYGVSLRTGWLTEKARELIEKA